MLGVRYLLSHDELPFPWCSPVAEFGSVTVYEVQGAWSPLTVRTGVVSESDASLMDAQGRAELLSASTIVPDEVATGLAGAPAQDVQTTYGGSTVDGPHGPVVSEPAEAQLDIAGPDTLSGTLTALADRSVACLAIPHTTGWHVYVNGVEVET